MAGGVIDEGDAGVGVSREAVAKVPRLGVAESVADVAMLVQGVGRLEVAAGSCAAVLLFDKVVDIGRVFPGIGQQLQGLSENALCHGA